MALVGLVEFSEAFWFGDIFWTALNSRPKPLSLLRSAYQVLQVGLVAAAAGVCFGCLCRSVIDLDDYNGMLKQGKISMLALRKIQFASRSELVEQCSSWH